MLMRLARCRRFTLDASPGDRVRLEDELAAQRLYLAIEETRFPERLVTDFRIDPEVADALVPTLILQPLTENAVKYAVARTHRPVRLEMRARRAGGRLELEVCDDGPGAGEPNAESGGVGLSNIEARLGVLYGEDASLKAGPRPEGGFRVKIVMPFEVAETQGES
jgi:LytS/YehU family sensor histidine kinase